MANEFKFTVTCKFEVTAYCTRGYGEDRSKTFDDRDEAVAYAQSLEKHFGAVVNEVWRAVATPHFKRIWPPRVERDILKLEIKK